MKKNSLIKRLQKLHFKRNITAVFFLIISICTYTIPVICILSALLAIVFSILALDKKKIIGILTILFAIASIVFSIYKYVNRPKKLVDPNMGKNVIIGDWESDSVSYTFTKDMVYTQYLNTEKDNYCTGKYAYEYSYTTDDGRIIEQDYDYTYYYVVVMPEYCMIDGAKDLSEELLKSKGLVFGFGNHDQNKSVIVNTITNKFIVLTKKH